MNKEVKTKQGISLIVVVSFRLVIAVAIIMPAVAIAAALGSNFT